MLITIKETGEQTTLEAIYPETGVNCAADLIGNTGVLFVWDEDSGTPPPTRDDYEWAVEYLENEVESWSE